MPRLLYGYCRCKNRLAIDPEEGAVVRAVLAAHDAGLSTLAAARAATSSTDCPDTLRSRVRRILAHADQYRAGLLYPVKVKRWRRLVIYRGDAIGAGRV